jgi:hypothetical protein
MAVPRAHLVADARGLADVLVHEHLAAVTAATRSFTV